MFGVSDRARALVGFSLMVIWTCRTFGGETQPAPQPPPARVPTYTFTPIGTLPGYERAFVNDINNAGQVVGTAWRVVFGAAEQKAFIFENGAISDLGTSDLYSGAEGINDFGHIVGFDSTEEVGGHPFLLNDDGLQQVMDCCRAVAVNNAGQVVVRTGLLSYLWDNGEITHLGTLGNNIPQTEATAINNLGQIVGKSSAPWPLSPFYRNFAFLWEEGQMNQLPVLIDGPSNAYDINESGWIIGMSDGKPVLWDDVGIHDLTLAPYNAYGSVWSINNFQYMVGTTSLPSPGHATVWHNGTTHNLNNLVPPETQWYLLWAKAINDRGEIAGEGLPPEVPYWQRGFFLQPTDCDSNDDGQVSLADHAMFQSCLTGPRMVPSLECAPIDFDRDGDVDFVDYRSLELAFEP